MFFAETVAAIYSLVGLYERNLSLFRQKLPCLQSTSDLCSVEKNFICFVTLTNDILYFFVTFTEQMFSNYQAVFHLSVTSPTIPSQGQPRGLARTSTALDGWIVNLHNYQKFPHTVRIKVEPPQQERKRDHYYPAKSFRVAFLWDRGESKQRSY